MIKFTKLYHQILAVFVTVVILTLGISGWVTIVLAQRIIADNITRQHQVLAHRIAEEITLRREDILPILSNLAESDSARSMNPTEVIDELRRYQIRFSNLASIYVADQAGQQIARTDGQPLENVATIFGVQVAQQGSELVSDVYLPQDDGGPVLTVYEPIFDDGTVVGVLVADVNFAWVQTILENLALVRGETAVVFAQNGRVVAHSRMEELVEPPTLTDPALIETLIQGSSGVLENYNDELGRTVVGSHAPVAELGWGVVIQSPVEELTSEVTVLRRTIGLGLLGSVALAVIVGWLMARRLTRPINRLMQVVKHVEAGDLSARSSRPYGPEELGQLARAFDEMTTALQRRNAEALRATRALQESEARYRGLFEDSPISLWEEDFSAVKLDLDGLRDVGITDLRAYIEDHPQALRDWAAMVKVVDVNKTTLDMLQYESKEAVLENLARVFREESYEVFREELVSLVEGDPVFETEAINRTSRGDEIYVSLKLTVAPGYEDTWSKVFVSLTDISKRKRVEKQLRESEASLLKAQQIAHLGNWDWDITTGGLAWSDEIYRIFGLAPQEFGATYEAFLRSVHPEDREYVRESVNRAVYERAPYNIEHRVVRPDGNTRTVNEVGEVTYDQAGKPVRMVGTVLDITERKRAEQALHHYAEHLKTLRAIDQAILTAQSPEAIARAALRHIQQLVPCQRASLTSIDLESQEATVLGVHVNGETSEETGTRFPLEAIQDLERLQQGQVEMVGDIAALSQPSPMQMDLQAEGVRSYIVVPLIAQGDLIGTLNLASKELAACTTEHVDVARDVADQLAIAIRQAQLYGQVQRHAAELEQRVIQATAEIRQRADELAALYDVSRDMVASLDLGALLPIVAERLADSLGADRCIVFLFNEESGALEARAAYGYMAERLADFSYRPGEEIVGQAFAKREPQYVPDLDRAPDLPRRDAVRTVLAMPLVSATAGTLGVLSVGSLMPGAFTLDQQRLLETMTGQITGAIENARLYRAAERHSMELTALYEVGKEITATLKLDTILQTIADVAVRLAGADKSLILLVDIERERLLRAVGCGYSQAQLGGHTFEEFRDGLSGWVLQEKASIISANIQTDERNQGKALCSAQQSGDGSAAVAPLSIGDEIIGTLTVINSQQKGIFTLADLNLVTMMAGQAAAAIQNARLYEAAQEADRLKSAFLATMSHELRTPLNSIIGFTGIILQGLAGPLTDEQIKQLAMVQGSARHLLDLINDVLDISKIEAGQLEVSFEPFDMRAAVKKTIQTVTPLAEKKGLTLVAEVTPEVGQIASDRRRVEQILINLLNNAIKFTERGQARVECRVSGDQLVTRVVDTGIGIRSEDMEKLFRPFHQIETGLTRRHEGTGLGLSISQKLVEMLGGEIWVESEWGEGSTFTFSLPLARGEKDETQGACD